MTKNRHDPPEAQSLVESKLVREEPTPKRCFCGGEDFKVYLDVGKLAVLVCKKCSCHRSILYGTYGHKDGHGVSIPFAEDVAGKGEGE